MEGRDDAVLAYGGLQGRLVFDVGTPNGLQVELSMHARGDFRQKRRTLVLDHSFLGSNSELDEDEWNVGGFALTWAFGLSYQF